jgi:hypothetical protein
VKLREERRHFESGADDAFAEISDCFRNDANAAFVFGREEEGTKKWAVDAIAESELGLAEAFEKFGGKIRIFPEGGPQQSMPMLDRIGRRRGSLRGCAHYLFFVPAALDSGCAGFGAAAGAGRAALGAG